MLSMVCLALALDLILGFKVYLCGFPALLSYTRWPKIKVFLKLVSGSPGSPGKSQNEGQEDQGKAPRAIVPSQRSPLSLKDQESLKEAQGGLGGVSGLFLLASRVPSKIFSPSFPPQSQLVEIP